MVWGTPPSQGFLDHPSPSSAPLILHSTCSLSEVSFHPCTPGTLAPCLWSPLAGCCCYGNGILRAFSSPLRQQARMEIKNLLHSQACLDGR